MSTWDPHVECACQKGAAAAIFSPNGGVKWGQKHGLCDDVVSSFKIVFCISIDVWTLSIHCVVLL